MPNLSVRQANKDDLPALLPLTRSFATEDGNDYGDDQVRVVTQLVETTDFGPLFIIELAGQPIGYAFIALGFSIEFGGRDAILDEFYIVPAHRGQGHGRQVLNLIEDWARQFGLVALHLEVMDGSRAGPLYRGAGYETRFSRYMSKMIS